MFMRSASRQTSSSPGNRRSPRRTAGTVAAARVPSRHDPLDPGPRFGYEGRARDPAMSNPDLGLRPSSALEVSAALPGGDPLAAALAAGETPSPRWWPLPVRQRACVREWRPRSSLGSPSVWVWCSVLTPQVTLLGHLPLQHPPEELRVRARDVVRGIGYTGEPADTETAFRFDAQHAAYLARTAERADAGRNPQRDAILAPGPWPVYFTYQQTEVRLIRTFTDLGWYRALAPAALDESGWSPWTWRWTADYCDWPRFHVRGGSRRRRRRFSMARSVHGGRPRHVTVRAGDAGRRSVRRGCTICLGRSLSRQRRHARACRSRFATRARNVLRRAVPVERSCPSDAGRARPGFPFICDGSCLLERLHRLRAGRAP